MSPAFSVIIPTYNRASDLDRALACLLAQTLASWEAVIVDNHSSDDTDDVVARFDESRFRLFKVHNEGIVAKSRNVGIEHARGEFVAFLDSDDWWTERKLEVCHAAFARGADVVYHDLYAVRATGQARYAAARCVRPLNAPVFDDLMRDGNALANSGVCVRTPILRAIGALSEEPALVGAEDFDLWLRTARLTDRFTLVPEILGYYWMGGGNLTNPARSLVWTDTLEQLHAEAFARIPGGPWWLNYARGRAQFQLGRYADAAVNLGRLNWLQAPVLVAAKALLMRARCLSSKGIGARP